jgi:hypothetical protein
MCSSLLGQVLVLGLGGGLFESRWLELGRSSGKRTSWAGFRRMRGWNLQRCLQPGHALPACLAGWLAGRQAGMRAAVNGGGAAA